MGNFKVSSPFFRPDLHERFPGFNVEFFHVHLPANQLGQEQVTGRSQIAVLLVEREPYKYASMCYLRAMRKLRSLLKDPDASGG